MNFYGSNCRSHHKSLKYIFVYIIWSLCWPFGTRWVWVRGGRMPGKGFASLGLTQSCCCRLWEAPRSPLGKWRRTAGAGTVALPPTPGSSCCAGRPGGSRPQWWSSCTLGCQSSCCALIACGSTGRWSMPALTPRRARRGPPEWLPRPRCLPRCHHHSLSHGAGPPAPQATRCCWAPLWG